MKELDAEWEKLEGGAVPTRFIRSEQAAAEAAAASGGGGAEDDAGGDDDEGVAVSAAPIAIDPYDLADPVDMLGKLPKNFYDQLVCSDVCDTCTCTGHVHLITGFISGGGRGCFCPPLDSVYPPLGFLVDLIT